MTLYPGESAQLEMRILVPDYKLMLAKNYKWWQLQAN